MEGSRAEAPLRPPETGAFDPLHLGDSAAAKLDFKAAVEAYKLALTEGASENGEARKAILSSLQAVHLRPLAAPRLQRPADVEGLSLFALRPARRRLLVLDAGHGVDEIEALGANAQDVHILIFADLWGMDIDLARLEGRGNFAIEHARSRITRFAPLYVALHKQTASLADELFDLLGREGLLATMPGDLAFHHRSLRLKFTDDLFFQALRAAAVSEALADPGFDHVVLAFGASTDLFEAVASIPNVFDDARVDCCCLTPRAEVRRAFADRLARARMRAEKDQGLPYAHQLARRRREPPAVAADLAAIGDAIRAQALTHHLARAAGAGHSVRPRVLMVTGEQRGYMSTNLDMALDWQAEFDAEVAYVGGDPGAPGRHFDAIGCALTDRPPTIEMRLADAKLSALGNEWGKAAERFALEPLLALVGRQAPNRFAALALDVVAPKLLRRTVPAMAALAVLAVAVIGERSYSAVAISPGRSPRTGLVAEAARRRGVPSITIEPHTLNSTYVRYGTVPTDYVTLISDYFRDEYAARFGIPAERCFLVGSPRISRPKGFDRAAARRAARETLGMEEDARLVAAFASQPTRWGPLAEVWTAIVEAASSLRPEVRLLLKTHREDDAGAAGRYLAIAASLGAADLVTLASDDAKGTIDASDLLLTCYSTMAMEAVVREVDVAIVTSGGRRYPLPYQDVIDVPLCGTAEEIAGLMRRLLHEVPKPRLFEGFRRRNPHMYDGRENERLREALWAVINRGREGIRREDDLPTSLFVRSDEEVFEV